MSSIGFDSCFYDRLDQFSRSLNHVLLAARGKTELAHETDWQQTLELIQTLAALRKPSLAASSVAACLRTRVDKETAQWSHVAEAVARRILDQDAKQKLYQLAWSLDEERVAVLARMRAGHA
ncbi:MAG: hypothetical protein HY298_20810 [Verrucomicrobia bacterium]|nr:hypothetical protein [Verrucomicrobiota bacterium]